MSNVNNNPRTPFDALGKLMGTLGAEGRRATGELTQQAVADIDSIGRAVETGGFLGGLVQFMDKNSVGNHAVNLLDAATGPGSLPPQLREGVAAALNYATGNPIALKDLFDLATAPSQPRRLPPQPFCCKGPAHLHRGGSGAPDPVLWRPDAGR